MDYTIALDLKEKNCDGSYAGGIIPDKRLSEK